MRDFDALQGRGGQRCRAAWVCPRHRGGANAGIGNGWTMCYETGESDWDDMIGVNLSGVWKTVKSRGARI